MSDAILDLPTLRQTALKFILGAIWLQPVFVLAASWVNDAPVLYPTAAALLIAGLAQGVAYWDRDGGQARIAAGVALMAQISVLVGVFSGQKMQVDLHMYYFAALALLVAFCDWKVIAAATVTVAVHHTVLNFVLPSLIYPDGSDFLRLALHAVILVIEAAVLMWMVFALEKMFAAIDAEAARAEENRLAAEKSHAEALAAAEQAQAAHRLHEQDQTSIMAEREKAAAEQARVLGSIGEGLRNLAQGNLSFRLDQTFDAEYQQLKDDFNAAMERLHDTVQAIASSANDVTNAVREIATGTSDLAERTEQQAGNLVKTSASMEEIAATVKHNAENAVQADQLAGATSAVAERGSHVVEQAVEAMSRIEASSRKIADIIAVIDEIARQTNLLALNAAVEAARAGEAGRGFAVVAVEVRSLAQRSAQAAKDIKDIITSSSSQVQDGVTLVNSAGNSLVEIVDSIKKVTAIVSEIAAASGEQATGLDHVNKSLAQLEEVTQQNSALVEENAAAAQSLEMQAAAMAERVRFFQTRGMAAAGGAARPAASAARLAGAAPKRAAAVAVADRGVKRPAPAPVKAPAARTPTSEPAAVAARRGGPVGKMQAALASAIQDDQSWEEF